MKKEIEEVTHIWGKAYWLGEWEIVELNFDEKFIWLARYHSNIRMFSGYMVGKTKEEVIEQIRDYEHWK